VVVAVVVIIIIIIVVVIVVVKNVNKTGKSSIIMHKVNSKWNKNSKLSVDSLDTIVLSQYSKAPAVVLLHCQTVTVYCVCTSLPIASHSTNTADPRLAVQYASWSRGVDAADNDDDL